MDYLADYNSYCYLELLLHNYSVIVKKANESIQFRQGIKFAGFMMEKRIFGSDSKESGDKIDRSDFAPA